MSGLVLYACSGCRIQFRSEEKRCPECMRRSTVQPAHELLRAEHDAEIDAHHSAMPKVLLRMGLFALLGGLLLIPLAWSRWLGEIGLIEPLVFGAVIFTAVSVTMSSSASMRYSDILGLATVSGGSFIVGGWMVNLLLPDLHFVLRGAIAVPIIFVSFFISIRVLRRLFPGFLRD